ncbi:Conidial pigment biosynthesis dehydratase EthD [Cladobotryum mycophilum]|uniref:Conidial pigment biosynthesis dehydratase EthD n=1 Tax=Cladobotryum mycophilum TaxID=491253 RepID=A0ABR0S862_9HYPO
MSTPSPPPLYMLSFIKRRPDLSEEQFYAYWRNIHAPKVVPWAQKHNLVGYTQIHTPSNMRQTLAAVPVPLSLLDYDGAVIWEIPSLEVFLNAFADPYYLEIIAPDEAHFLDRKVATMTLGHCHPIIAGCKPLIELSN